MGGFPVVVRFVGGMIYRCERERVLKLIVSLYVGWCQSAKSSIHIV